MHHPPAAGRKCSGSRARLCRSACLRVPSPFSAFSLHDGGGWQAWVIRGNIVARHLRAQPRRQSGRPHPLIARCRHDAGLSGQRRNRGHAATAPGHLRDPPAPRPSCGTATWWRFTQYATMHRRNFDSLLAQFCPYPSGGRRVRAGAGRAGRGILSDGARSSRLSPAPQPDG